MMADQRTIAPKISSFAAPTAEDIAIFDSLTPEEKRALLREEIDKGFSSGLSDRSVDQIVAAARAKARARNG
jgi:hypothetical protein